MHPECDANDFKIDISKPAWKGRHSARQVNSLKKACAAAAASKKLMGAANSNIAMLRHLTIARGIGHDVAVNHVRACDTRTDGKHYTNFMHLAVHCRKSTAEREASLCPQLLR